VAIGNGARDLEGAANQVLACVESCPGGIVAAELELAAGRIVVLVAEVEQAGDQLELAVDVRDPDRRPLRDRTVNAELGVELDVVSPCFAV